jgi:hypothetical protein
MLKIKYGQTYRTKFMRHPDGRNEYVIPHKWPTEFSGGYFFPYASGSIGCIMAGSTMFNRLKRDFPSIEVRQKGSDEIVFMVPHDIFPSVAKRLRAGRRRHVSPENREKATARFAQLRLAKQNPNLAPATTR